jgi:hypothetical protein
MRSAEDKAALAREVLSFVTSITHDAHEPHGASLRRSDG